MNISKVIRYMANKLSDQQRELDEIRADELLKVADKIQDVTRGFEIEGTITKDPINKVMAIMTGYGIRCKQLADLRTKHRELLEWLDNADGVLETGLTYQGYKRYKELRTRIQDKEGK